LGYSISIAIGETIRRMMPSRLSDKGKAGTDCSMASEQSRTQRVLITGGFGCIGAETAKWLLANTDNEVVVCSRCVSLERIERVFGDADSGRLTCLEADVTDQSRLLEILTEHRVSHVAHMAGLQTPDCNAHRDLGLQVNLAGAQNLIEAMKASGLPLQRFVFASSAAVYGPRAAYPPGRVPLSAEPQPVNVYGAWKLAGENISRFFADETGIPTISVRPGALFGPGRDAGLTATPTTALKHVAMGRPYEIPYRSRQDYLYSPDVGAAVGNALVEPFEGYAAFTLPSHTVETSRFVSAIQAAARELGIERQCSVTAGSDDVPFICDLDFTPFLEAFPKSPHTPFQQAVRDSLVTFLDQLKRYGSLPGIEC
jgi:UDP-glucose 4-epimerase